MKTNKEILLDWIDTFLIGNIFLNQNNFEKYLGNTEEIFILLTEYKIRKLIVEAYLDNPKEETIINVLSDIQSDYKSGGYSGAEKKALNRVLLRFNQPLFQE